MGCSPTKRLTIPMFKPTPNPPELDPVSPYECPNSRKLNEAAERALDHYLCPAAQTTAGIQPEPMYLANPRHNSESLLVNASETLGSASVLLTTFADSLDPSPRKALLGIAQVVMLGELAVNQALDHVEVTS